jgi:hypothetical protein
MALTITPQISGQVASSTISYSFMQEPLKVYITDSDADTRIIYADVTKINTDDGVVVSTDLAYVYRDVSSNGGVVVDLSKVMGQMHDYNTINYGSVLDISNGWESVVSKYIYKFEFYSDTSPSIKTTIQKLPIIGGRSFDTFIPSVTHNTPIRELSNSEIVSTNKIGNYKDVVFTLKNISSVTNDDYSPTSALSVDSSTNNPCEGVVYWKSKLGGWMMMGVDIKSESKSHKYNGTLSNGMFESTSYTGGGDVYVSANYMGTSSNLTINLKTLSLDASVLKAVSEIAGSPAVYYHRPVASGATPSSSDRLELMRMTSSSAPIKTHIGGGDFTLSLTRISSTEYKTK